MPDGRPGPKVFVADKGYDADRIRNAIEQTGGTGIIPTRRSRKAPVPIDGFIYALRNRIERCFNKLKNSRRLAIRFDKIAGSCLGFIYIAAVQLWIRYFVNAT